MNILQTILDAYWLSNAYLVLQDIVIPWLYQDEYLRPHADYPITILIPAYNEESTIISSVNQCLKSYSVPHLKIDFNVIVIDDGSKDKTSDLLIEYFHMHEKEKNLFYSDQVNVRLLKKQNGGKANSINAGIRICGTPYFTVIDADTLLRDNALYQFLEELYANPKLVAIGGNIIPS